jgi:hypothetical protein
LPPGKQENMPIEESANLLIMLAAIAQRTLKTDFIAPRFWPLLKQWADYLVQTSLDPGDQLCTDDFEGMPSSPQTPRRFSTSSKLTI